MVLKKKGTTQTALDFFYDEQKLFAKYSTAESILDYLNNTTNFKSLSDVLKETMIKAKICKKNADEQTFISELFNRLKKQDEECGKKKSRSEKTIQYWFNGNIKSIRFRKDVIEICFALNLNTQDSRTLLNECQFNSLNVRNAIDAIYLYCIIKGYTLKNAQTIISEYQEHIQTHIKENSHNYELSLGEHSGNTTYILNDLITTSNWENDDDFFNTFLINKHKHFIGFSTNALNEYYKWKNNLWFIIISDIILNELMLYRAIDKKHYNTQPQDYCPTILSIISALNKHKDKDSIFYHIYESFNKCIPYFDKVDENIENTLKNISELINKKTDIESRIQISNFLSDIIKAEGLMKRTLTFILSKSDRLRNLGESSLKNTVLKNFPTDDTFTKFEKNPSSMNDSISIRKAIILMYYITYSFEFFSNFTNINFNHHFSNFGFQEFYNGINEVLLKCQLHPLYPPNQFDWLICRSIKEFDSPSYYGDHDAADPILLFNEVINHSFDSSQDEQ